MQDQSNILRPVSAGSRMSGFSFSFSGDDIEDEHEEEATVLGLNEDTQMYEPQSMPPQSHSLESMVGVAPPRCSASYLLST